MLLFDVIFAYIVLRPHASFEDIVCLHLNNLFEVPSNDVLKVLQDNTYNRLRKSLDELEYKFLSQELVLSVDDTEIPLNYVNYLSVLSKNVNDKNFNEYQKHIDFAKNGYIKYDIELVTEFNYEQFKSDVLSVSNTYNIKMKKPVVKLVNGKIELVEHGQKGRRIDEERLLADIENILKTYESLDTSVVKLYFNDIDILPSESDLLEIDTKISSFTTGYSSSGSSRKQNISVASKRLNGVVLVPGEVLSVDTGIGGRNAKNGYAKAGSYLNGKTVQTYGGGVCQVSTTLYGAVLRAGLVPIERNSHSMAVGYVPLGLDAAISEGYKDLKIKNTYNYPIYIEAIANGSSLIFNLYGKKDLLGGYSYVPGSKANGLKATAWLNKMKDGKVVEKITLNSSSYRPHK